MTSLENSFMKSIPFLTMTFYIKLILISLLCFSFIVGFSQETSNKGNQVFTAAQLEHDFNILCSELVNIHPDVYAYISEDSLNAIKINIQKKFKDGLTLEAFHVLVRQYIRNIHCGHTVARPSEDWYALQKNDSKLLTFNVFYVNDKVYVKEYLGVDSALAKGVEILSINQITTSKIVADMKAIQERDGFSESYDNRKVERYFSTYFLFLYGRKDHYTVLYQHNGNKDSVIIEGGKFKKQKAKTSTIDTSKFSLGPKSSFAELKYFSNLPNTALFDINSFDSKGYNKFYKSVFKELKAKSVNNLIIDLRDNGGGYFPHGNNLLRYLMPQQFNFTFSRDKGKVKKQAYLAMDFFSKMTKSLFNLIPDKDKNDPRRNYVLSYKPRKKNHFDGQLYVFINGNSFSLSSYTAAQLSNGSNAIFIGEETGGGKSGSNALLLYNLTLPETKIRINLPYYHLDHGIKNPLDNRGLMPDYKLEYSIEDLMQGRDIDLEQVEKLIKKNE